MSVKVPAARARRVTYAPASLHATPAARRTPPMHEFTGSYIALPQPREGAERLRHEGMIAREGVR